LIPRAAQGQEPDLQESEAFPWCHAPNTSISGTVGRDAFGAKSGLPFVTEKTSGPILSVVLFLMRDIVPGDASGFIVVDRTRHAACP
jgi:hypothetical protein